MNRFIASIEDYKVKYIKVFLESPLISADIMKNYVLVISDAFFVARFGLVHIRLVSFGLSWQALLIGSAFIWVGGVFRNPLKLLDL